MSNRLANETSPYLLQHAHNPVDWWPWCDEAFIEARRRNVPVFLSIGYSTCYWCHVMERESFEDHATAEVLNARFVAIKVDREERPDVDEVYMAATVIMTGHGGWPMSVFIEPQSRRPFWCGTYFPKEPRSGMPTLTQVLVSIADAYANQGGAVEQQATELAAAVSEQVRANDVPAPLSRQQPADAAASLLRIFDRVNGGFGSAPKFPQPVFLEFLLDARAVAGDDSTADAIDLAVRRTLDKMACGGMRDQAGGGFHRYSVDAIWLVPHFEKMLYDNAQLAAVYARAARRDGDAFFEHVVRSTLGYVSREMTSPEGGFYSAQDAEVDGREGLNYLWTPEEVRSTVGADDADLALSIYGLDKGPNFQDPHHRAQPPLNVLRLDDRPDRLAPRLNTSPQALADRLAAINAALYTARQARKQPRLDDKVITAWNGLMIAAFADAARELEDPSLLAPARRAAEFLLTTLISSRGGGERQLLRTWRAGQAAGRAPTPAFLEDHAFLIKGLLALARASNGVERGKHLAQARDILTLAQSAFYDDHTGAWHDMRAPQDGANELFVRTRTTHDGAIPCGVSVMLHNLLDLAELIGEPAFVEQATLSFTAISGAIAENPVGAINSTRALLRLLVADPAAAAAMSAFPAPEPRETPAPHGPASSQAMEVYASTERISIREGEPAQLTLFVKIADGYHVPAAVPGVPGLLPLRIAIINGTGVAAYADYPPGEPYADGLLAYTGSFELTIALERQGPWSGQPLLSLRYQACTDTECLKPATLELDIAIDRA